MNGNQRKMMQANAPDPLFGAIQRMHPATQSKEKSLIFGSSLPSLPNPFNLNFEIPPLPSLSLLQQQNLSQKDEVSGLATSEFNFFSYLTQKQKKSSPMRKRSPPGSPSKLLARSRSPSSPNRHPEVLASVSTTLSSSPVRR